MLIDTYGRIATDLRVSLTDRCNLRCTYCMPEEGLKWLARPDLLTDDEIVRLIRIAVTRLGVTEVRFTGGEPLLRPGLVGIVDRVARLAPRPRISLTTNGIGLARTAAALKAAGLDRVNVSLDTLRPDVFKTLTRRDRHHDVLAGLDAAHRAGLTPVKINTVLMRGLNDDEAPELLAWAIERDYELRFIEQMPLDAQHGWKRDGMITAGDILASLRTRFTLDAEESAVRGSAPAERWTVDGGPYRVGVIGSVTRPFCAACDRTRLTADGQVRNCLFAREETDLRAALRTAPRTEDRAPDGTDAASDGTGAASDEGAVDADGNAVDPAEAVTDADGTGADPDEEIVRLWKQAMWGKKAGSGLDDPAFLQPERPMSAIGG
ncbi:GTP 3',8-cyclase MoaA [Streptomyces uncialis]|uniref:GTP 3',8-cyclase MoaA n=1 Tax=Streptomyces uncialis TaxID=1048205 RepID=UPI00381E8BBB